jgi:hypothetical protein
MEDRTPRRRTRGTRRVQGWTTRGGGDRFASGSTSTHRFRRSHLIRPPVPPRDDNRVVIVPYTFVLCFNCKFDFSLLTLLCV